MSGGGNVSIKGDQKTCLLDLLFCPRFCLSDTKEGVNIKRQHTVLEAGVGRTQICFLFKSN